jgi:hypothetical protein
MMAQVRVEWHDGQRRRVGTALVADVDAYLEASHQRGFYLITAPSLGVVRVPLRVALFAVAEPV